MVMVMAYVGLGANLGEAVATVRWAIHQVTTLPDSSAVAQSSLYRSAPVDASGPNFINAVVAINTTMPALQLLQKLQQLEHLAGRERPYRNAPRTLDLDLLLYGDECISRPELQVPHPRMWQRAFVLVPLAEIAPKRVTAAQLMQVQAQSISRLDLSFNRP
jgi:2-amino-4-hydroxy-6-hydroxymethyldihydropteridine diphosphokinase